MHSVSPVLDLIYWRDVKKTAIVLATSLLILTIFAIFPLLSIISYTSLLVLTVTFGLRLYGNIVCYIKKSKEPHLLRLVHAWVLSPQNFQTPAVGIRCVKSKFLPPNGDYLPMVRFKPPTTTINEIFGVYDRLVFLSAFYPLHSSVVAFHHGVSNLLHWFVSDCVM